MRASARAHCGTDVHADAMRLDGMRATQATITKERDERLAKQTSTIKDLKGIHPALERARSRTHSQREQRDCAGCASAWPSESVDCSLQSASVRDAKRLPTH